MKNILGKERLDFSQVWRRVRKSVDPNRFNILFLIPLAATAIDDDEKAMTRQQLLDAFPGNTVIAELPTGTAYSYVLEGGTANGLHPTYGKISGTWEIDEKGVTCITWPLPSNNEIKNCSKTVPIGGNKYNWANQVIRVQAGDPKKLAN